MFIPFDFEIFVNKREHQQQQQQKLGIKSRVFSFSVLDIKKYACNMLTKTYPKCQTKLIT